MRKTEQTDVYSMIEGVKERLLRLAPGEQKELRRTGRDHPILAETMIGWERLEQLEDAVRTVVREGIAGDVMECGVWRGGACILMKKVLDELQDKRKVWVCDSFEGVPAPTWKQDEKNNLWQYESLRVSEEEVRGNFEAYDALDERVIFLHGWFKDTLPTFKGKISVLRLDGDLYESTWIALENLYPKVSKGGYVIIDDYLALDECNQAVRDFRNEQGITAQVNAIDWTGIWWRK